MSTSNAEYLRRWRAANPDKVAAAYARRQHLLKTDPEARERHRKHNRDSQRRHSEHHNEQNRKRYAEDPEYRKRVLAKTGDWSKANPARRNEIKRKWRQANPDKVRKQHAKQYISGRDNLTDGYVRGTLSAHSEIPQPAWPQELVDLQRETLKLKRKLKKGTHK